MSIALMTAAWKSSLPGTAKLVLLALCDSANDLGECYPRMRTLAQKCSMSERTVQRQISAMESVGLIVREIRLHRASLYTVNLDNLPAAEALYQQACGQVQNQPDTVSPYPDTVSPTPRHSVTMTPTQCHHDPDTVSPLIINRNKNRKENRQLTGTDGADTATEKKLTGKSFDFRAALVAEGVDEGMARDWIAARNKKRAANTEAALNRLKREAEKAGVTLQFAVQVCAENSWASADVDLLRKQNGAPKESMHSSPARSSARLAQLGKHGAATAENAEAWLAQQGGGAA